MIKINDDKSIKSKSVISCFSHICMIFGALICLSLLNACSPNDESGSIIRIQTDFTEKSYSGGLVKAWVNVKDFNLRADQDDLVNWKLGKGNISKRVTAISAIDSIIVSDTVWFEWNVAPELYLDSTEVDSVTWTVDSLYLDSIAIDIEGIHSAWKVFDIQNVLPMLDTLYLGGVVTAIRDSVIRLYGHPGQLVEFDVTLRDNFVEDFAPRFEFEDVPGLRQIQSDSGYAFRWQAPDSIVDDVFEFKVRDESYSGSRIYYMQMITYKETGSVWVGASKDLIKISSTGSEIFRIENQFQEISDIGINPNRIYVWILDRGKNILTRMTNSGEIVLTDSSKFIQPTALGVDVQSGAIWVADLPSSAQGRVRKFDPAALDSLSEISVLPDQQGPVTSIAIDQFEDDLMMFVVPEGDSIGLVRDGVLDTLFHAGVNRPQHIAYDAQLGQAWVADSSSVMLIDTLGVIKATIKGFNFISDLSTGNGEVCISDARADQIIRFNSNISGNLTKTDGLVTEGFNTPAGVAFSMTDNSCWVADSESGSVAKVNSDGNIVFRVTGMDQPKIIAVHQGVE